MPKADQPITASLSRDGLALFVTPDFGALAMRSLQLVGVGVFILITMAVAALLSRTLTAFDRWIAYAVAAVVCGVGLIVVVQLLRFWPGREIVRRARVRFERAVAAGEPEAVLHARAVDLAVAASLPKGRGFSFDFTAWRNALADAGLRPVGAVFFGDAPPDFMQSLEDPGLVEPEDFSDHTNMYAGQPGCLVWAAAIGGCAAVAGAMTSGRWLAFLGPMFFGLLALLAILASFRFRPVQTNAVFVAPGRIAWSLGRTSFDAPRGEAVVVAQRSTGTIVVAIHGPGQKRAALFFRGTADERYRRFMQLWLAPREPAPRIFEESDRR